MKYKRKFECDKSIVKGIKWLNTHKFYTISSCSGIESDHPNSERDKMFVEFEVLEQSKINVIKSVAREVGFDVKSVGHDKIARIETSKQNKLQVFNDFIGNMKTHKGGLELRTMGISNWAYDTIQKKRYSVQFYDYDYNGGGRHISKEDLLKIMQIFPYDCIMYETNHGVHFISFALLRGLNITKARVLETTKRLGKQDYWTEGKDLTLRVSPKWKPTYLGYKIISEKPVFKGLSKFPTKYRISFKHLEFYRKYMDLPDWVYNCYKECEMFDYKIKIYHYKTRD